MTSSRPAAGTRRLELRSTTGSLACFSVFLISLLACSPPESPSAAHQISGPTMGTRYTVKVAIDSLSADRQREVRSAIDAALEDVNAKMSHYLEGSEISRLNRWRDPEPFALSSETLEVLQHAREISSITEGAFDITVGPLVDAWGFGPPGRPAQPPATEEIQRLLAITGWELLEIDRISSTVRKAVPDLRLDLSAIAKGFGVDRVADALDALGIEHYMVEVGGEVRTRGHNTRHEPWQIGIERPLPGERTIELILPLSGLAMATSGDYRNYYEIEGRRISHTLDPRTGYPLTHSVASVSVVAPLCVRADAYATALLVLGPEGFDLAERLGLAAYFLQRDKGEIFVGRMTTRFRELLGE